MTKRVLGETDSAFSTYRGVLPHGWTESRLAGLIARDGLVTDGDWVETKDQDQQGNVRLIQLADLGDGEYRNRSSRFLTSEKAAELGCTFLKPGDVLIARMPDPLGRACLFPGDPRPSVTVVDVCIVRPGDEGVDANWLLYTINSADVRRSIESLQRGTTRNRISRRNLESLILPVPPLAEQGRIVAKVEELLAHVDPAGSRLALVPEILKRFRQSLLAAACDGRLTEDWRGVHRDVEPSTDYLNRILLERQASGQSKPGNAALSHVQAPDRTGWNIPVSWAWTSLSTLATQIGDVDHKMPRAVESGIPYISTKDFTGDDDINFEGAKRISESDFSRLATKIKPEFGDVLLSRYGTVGELRLVRDRRDFQASYSIAIIKPIRFGRLSEYMYWALRSELAQSQMRRSIQASSQPDLGLAHIRSLVIPVPPKAEQAEIVRRVEALFRLAYKIEERVTVAAARTVKLTPVILSKAFRGELVPTEAELARREGRDYEPASVLLERIRAEREKASAGGRRGRRVR